MQRRRFLRLAVGSGVALAGVGAGALWLGGAPRSLTAWPLPCVLEHAAQSVEYSWQGYPEPKSPLFRSTLGPLAFRVFARRGRMSHDTREAIPGAPPLTAEDVAQQARRLANAILRFEARPEAEGFAPHFAYGVLSKDDYRRAHLMHVADHAREVAFA
jgi:hypothetical protein